MQKTHRRIPLLIISIFIIFAIILGVIIINLRNAGDSSLSVVQLPCALTDTIAVFGDNIVVYDGAKIYGMSQRRRHLWSHEIGANANLTVINNSVVAWSGRQINILDANGNVTYNNTVSDNIITARAGKSYIGVLAGSDDAAYISVYDYNGQNIERVETDGLMPMDFGFFGANGDTMWVMSLNIEGTAPMTVIDTYQPGKKLIGSYQINSYVAYSIFDYNDLLYVINSRDIIVLDQNCKLQSDKGTLVYGWYAQHRRATDKMLSLLLINESQSDGVTPITDLRLINGQADIALHLPVGCMNVFLGQDTVYGISETTILKNKFGERDFTQYGLNLRIDSVVDIIGNNAFIIKSGSYVYIVTV